MKKKSYLLILLLLVVGIVSTVIYRTLSYDTKVEVSDNNYIVSLTGSNEVVTLKEGEVKSVLYRVTNTNKGKVSYGIGHSIGNVEVRVYSDYYDDIEGILDYGESKYVRLYLRNNSTGDSTVTLKTILGYEKGGDLIVPEGYKLVTLKYYPLSKGKYFNGTSDYVDMGYEKLKLESFSVGARISIEEQRQQQIVSNTDSGGFAIGPRANGRIDFYVYSVSKSGYVSCHSVSSIDTNKYHIIIGTYDKKSLKIYIDGVLDSTKDGINEDVIKSSSMPFTVGGEKDGGNINLAYSYKGRISDVFLTSEVLDEETIAKNFTDTFIYDENDSTYFYSHFE